MKAKPPLIQHAAVATVQLVAVVVLVTAGSSAAESDPGRVPPLSSIPLSVAADPHGASPLVVNGATDETRAHLDYALERFREEGLDLPPLDIGFHGDRSGCEGHPGLFRMVAGVADIEVCVQTEYMILHELGHAWIAHNIDDETRSALVKYWSLPTWNDQDVEWSLRANEWAADSIAFGLAEVSPYVAQTLVEYLCAYTMLTERSVDVALESECPACAAQPQTAVGLSPRGC